MALEDLELEFEDEEEQQKKGSDAVSVDVDLSFNTSNEESTSGGLSPAVQEVPTQPAVDKGTKTTNIVHLEKGTSKNISPARKPVNNQRVSTTTSSQESAYKEKILKLETEKKILIDIVSNAKLMDYKITRVLLKLNSEYPNSKKDGQQIKRYLLEFLKELEKY